MPFPIEETLENYMILDKLDGNEQLNNLKLQEFAKIKDAVNKYSKLSTPGTSCLYFKLNCEVLSAAFNKFGKIRVKDLSFSFVRGYGGK